MHKPRVLLDVDGVLADFLTPSLDILNRLSGRKHVAEDLTDWDLFSLYPKAHEDAFYEVCGQPGFCESLPVYPGTPEFVESLMSFADVYVVTSHMGNSRTWVWERDQWLKRHFDIPAKRIVHTLAKHICVGDVLIDDRPKNIVEWERAHGPKGIGLLWDACYNRQSDVGQRVTSPRQALGWLKNLRT